MSRMKKSKEIHASPKSALSVLLMPQLSASLDPIRRIAEPVILIGALLAGVSLACMASAGLWVLLLSCGLIYLLLRFVFGIDISLNTPVF